MTEAKSRHIPYRIAEMIAVAGAVVFVTGSFVGSAHSQAQSGPAAGVDLPIPAKAGYRKWARVNSKPVVFKGAPAEQCRNADASQMPGPHRDKYITVYVNSIGKKEMQKAAPVRFPVGTVILKEKLATVKSAQPELLTVMKKREEGFDPGRGDWEYFVLNGKGDTLLSSGKLENCQNCHRDARSQDFVFRNYGPVFDRSGARKF